MNTVLLIYMVTVFILSIMLHEIAHGWTALKFGDETAKEQNRLSFNPIRHLSLFGSFILPAILIFSGSSFLFGWAKPVPINPAKFTRYRLGMFVVSAAGILTNFALALMFTGAIRVFSLQPDSPVFWLLAQVVYINLILGFFNLIPIPPIDGSKILTSILGVSPKVEAKLQKFGSMVFLGFILAIFILPETRQVFMKFFQFVLDILVVLIGI